MGILRQYRKLLLSSVAAFWCKKSEYSDNIIVAYNDLNTNFYRPAPRLH